MKWDAVQFAVPTDRYICGIKMFPRTPVWKLFGLSTDSGFK